MKRGDWIASVIIGAAVGLLSQIILSNVVAAEHLTLMLRFAVFIGFIILAPLALWIISLIGRALPVIYQFGKFAAVGTLNTFVDIGVLNLEILLLGTPAVWGYRIFKGISFLAATTNSFLWNKFWTFDSREPANVTQAVKFYVAATVGFLLNVGLASYVFSDVTVPASVSLNVWANIGALTGVAASFLWNFLAYKFWVFKK